jgi:uncharacterized protein YigE (DUF2233 family)
VRKLSAAIFLCCVVAGVAQAEWAVKDFRDEPSVTRAVVHRHVDLENSDSGQQATVDLALFSTKSCRLRVIDNANGARDLTEAMRLTNCLAGVNGGYFDPNFAPLGLRIIDGKTTSRLTRGRLMTGAVASDNITQIFRVAEFPSHRKWNAALECGPFLVELGKPVRGLEGTREARRTFAAVGSGDRAAIGVCLDPTLADLARILATPQGDFKIQRALNFDGGSSTAFYFKRTDGSAFSMSEQKNVRDFVGVVSK